MKSIARIAILAAALMATPLPAQEDGDGSEFIVVTGSRIRSSSAPLPDRRPVIGLRRPADGAVRQIEIGSDSRDEDMRRDEVEAMLLAALDRAKRDGLSLVTGDFEVKEVTRDNWRNLFPGLAGTPDPDGDVDEDDDDDGDDSGEVQPGFEDDGSTATLRLMVKTRLSGSIADAQRKIATFAKAVTRNGPLRDPPEGASGADHRQP